MSHYPFDEELWARPYGIADLAVALKSVLDTNPKLGFGYWEEELLTNGFGVSISVSVDTTIKELIGISSKLPALVQLIKNELSSREYQNSIVESFDFPAPIRSACQQYLLYFVQFLRDLEVEADSELKEEAGKVLFTVTPRDKEQALSIVRDALAFYLQIPSSPELKAMIGGSSGIAVAQLQANILHLESQVILARAVLQAKEATIAARDTQILALQERLDLRQFIPAEKPEVKKNSDSEPIIDGVLAVKKYDLKFLQIDFPEILRKLKRRW